jgi:aspartate kinase
VTELKKIAEVNVEGGKAIVCCVGDNLRETPGVLHLLMDAVQDIRILMISQGASAINVTFVIDEDQTGRCVRSLHEVFFSKADPTIFD